MKRVRILIIAIILSFFNSINCLIYLYLRFTPEETETTNETFIPMIYRIPEIDTYFCIDRSKVYFGLFFSENETFDEVVNKDLYECPIIYPSIRGMHPSLTKYKHIIVYNPEWDRKIVDVVFKNNCDTIYVIEKTERINGMMSPALVLDSNDTSVSGGKKKLIKYTDTRFFTEVDGNYVPNDSVVLIKFVRNSKDRNDIKVLYQNHYHKTQELKPIG